MTARSSVTELAIEQRLPHAYPALFAEGRIGKLVAKNRIVMAPMGTELAEPDGSIGGRFVDYYEARARGGAGIVTVEYADVDPAGVASIRRFPPALDRDEAIPGWRDLARAIHRHGARAAVQIGHAGRQTKTRKLADWAAQVQPVAPSPVPCRHIVHEVPRELDPAEIRELVRRFVDAARRAAEAGFDAVNLHAAHGYLINAFLSPYSNHRLDGYGGDLEGRTRFLRDILHGIRREVSDELAIIVRLSVDEFVGGGLEPGDARAIALVAERAGADAVDISAAIYDSPEPHQVSPWGWPEAPLAAEALFVKQGVTVPVLVANRIHHPDIAERVLTSGAADFICMGRPLLADPDLPRKVERGATREVRWCISCNECVSSELRGDRDSIADHSVFCAVNPAAAREREYSRPRTGPIRRVVVVGAGFAGLEAATTLAQRGHTVELWEERHVIGGQALYAARVPHKQHELEQLMAYYRHELERLEVDVHLGRRVGAESLRAAAADTVVIATGERQRPPAYDIPVDGPPVVGFGQILGDGLIVGARVLVVGGGFAGADTATFLADEDPTRQITLVTRWDRVLPKMAPINRHVAIKKLAGLAGVTIHTGMSSLRYESGAMVVEAAEGGRWPVEADHVVNAGGMEPEVELYESLAGVGGRELHAAGGCVGAATFLQAIHGGARVGHAI